MSAFEGRVDTTLIGPAGIGPARLAQEAEASRLINLVEPRHTV